MTAGQETLLEPLSAVTARRPVPLIGDAAWTRILDLGASLPGAVSSFFGFECPLGGDAERVDFLFCSTRDEAHTQRLVDATPTEHTASPAWDCVRALSAAWNAQTSPLEGLQNLWLEFDVGSRPQAASAAVPSLFFGLTPTLARDPASALDLARRALAIVAPAALEAQRGARLSQLFAALPAGAYVFQLGAMLARDIPAIRVCVRDIDADGVERLLQSSDWAGDYAGLRALLESLTPHAARIDLDLDVGAQIGARIGLECYPGDDDAVGSRLAALTDWLIARAMCSPAQAAALREYHGLTHPRSVATPWPPSWSEIARARGPGVESCLCRWVHHLKIGFEAGRPCTAKAYLAVEHVPLDRRQLARAIEARRGALSA